MHVNWFIASALECGINSCGQLCSQDSKKRAQNKFPNVMTYYVTSLFGRIGNIHIYIMFPQGISMMSLDILRNWKYVK